MNRTILKTLKASSFAIGAVLACATAAHAATITLYASGPRGFDRKLVAAFEKATGNKVKLWASSTGKVLARLQAEHADPHADVVIVADQSAGLALQAQGVIEPYRPKAILDKLIPALKLPSDFVALGADTVAIVVNTKRISAGNGPKDWQDLLDAGYKDQISMPSPLLSGTASDFVLGYIQQHPNDAWSYFAKLKANGAIWPGPNAAALAPVKLGARSVLMSAVGHTSLKAKKKGNSLELVLPKSGTILIPRPIVILKSSRNKALAKKFVDFAFSKTGQKLVAKALLIPAVKGVSTDPIWPSLDDANFWNVDWNRMAADRASQLKRFDAEVIH